MKTNEKLNELIEHYGSQTKLAKVLKVTRFAVSQWISQGGLPSMRAIEIEVKTNGRFKAKDLVIME